MSAASNRASATSWPGISQFDANLIGGTAALGLISGAVVVHNPDLFPIVLLLDLWLLGHHHVIATFTRLCFSRQDLAEHRFLVFGLPVIVLAAAFASGHVIGWWVLGTTYFYWQWFHYTRQSWGVSRYYWRREGGGFQDNEIAAKLAFYLPPLWGILHRSWQAPDKFLGLDFKVLPTSGIVVDVVGAAAVLALAYWILLRVLAWRRGEFAAAHTLYVASHHIIFFVGYLAVEDVTHGWLVLNVWHNAQYVLFVWMQNKHRFRNGIDPTARSLSTLCQASNTVRYFVTCIAISSIVYFSIKHLTAGIDDLGLPILVLIYMTINFHHYIVDGMIWKSRRTPPRQALT